MASFQIFAYVAPFFSPLFALVDRFRRPSHGRLRWRGSATAQSQYLGGVYGTGPVSTSAPRDTVSYWDGDSVSGKPSIKIKLTEQKAYFYKGGQLVGISQLSTGREGTGTPTGSFKVIQKDQDHVSNLYGDYVDSADNVVMANVDVNKDPKPPGTRFKGAPMPYFMRVVGGVGLARGLSPGLSSLSRLHSDARVHGGKLLPLRLPRHARSPSPISGMPGNPRLRGLHFPFLAHMIVFRLSAP